MIEVRDRVEAQRERTLISNEDLKRPAIKVGYILLVLVLFLGTIATVFPIFWMITGALKSSREIFQIPPALFPKEWLWGNFAEAATKLNYVKYLTNTVVIAMGTWAAAIWVPALASYSLSKLRPAYGRIVLLAFLSTLMMPPQAYMIPRFLTIKSLGLLDSYWSLWLPATANAFNLLILKNTFDAIPSDLIDAARIDGAPEWRILGQLLIPLCKPVLSVLTILTFSGVWNDFFWPMVLISSNDKLPIMVKLHYFTSIGGFGWNIIMAVLFIVCLPPIIIFIIFQKQIIRGITFTGLKT